MNPSAPAPGVQNIPEAVQCYNCGSNGHFFNACPEPTRNPPFGLAAAQARGMAGVQGHNQQNAFKRQKIGNGPVVTRYPVPGPVITKFGPPPHGMPFHGTHGPQAQFAPQYPPQPLAPAHNFQQPQTSYGPQGYASQPQYGQYPSTVHQGQMLPYGIGTLNQHAPTQNQYGYGVSQPYYQQQPQYVGNGYNAAAVGQYPQPPTAQQLQQNTPYFQAQAGYQQPQPYPMQSYQPAYNGMAPAHGTSGAFSQTQQYGPGAQPHCPYQPNPAVPHGYPGSQRQPFAPQLQQYLNQPPQQWQQDHTQTLATQVFTSATNHPSNGTGLTHSVSTNGSIKASPSTVGATGESDTIAEQGPLADGPQDPAGEGSTTETDGGPIRPPFRATPIIDPFDIEWEESIKDYKYSPSVKAVPISTPITLKHEEFPALCSSGSTEVRSKYVRPQNLDVFILPIEKSLHWPALKDDPAFAEIDETLPSIAETDWIDYQLARRAHLASLENSPSPELTRRSIEDAHPQEPPQHHGEYRGDNVGGARSRSNSIVQDRPGSASRCSRSRSRTPNLRNRGGAYDANGCDDIWIPCGSESRQVTPQLDDQKEALLASLGVSGTPKPVVPGNVTGQPRNMRVMPGVPSRQDSGYLSGRPSISSGLDTDVSKSDSGRGMSWSAQNPPPPPPSGRLQHGHGDYGSRGQSPPYSSNHSHTSSRNQSRSASANRSTDESPLSPTSAALLGHIPMEGETNGRKRRQGDDHYVRRKPQPRVDEAFSRRW